MEIFLVLTTIIFVSLFAAMRFHTILNPISLYSLSYFLTLTSALLGGQLAELLSLRVAIEKNFVQVSFVYLLSILMFTFPWMVGKRVYKYNGMSSLEDARHMNITVFFLTSLLLFVVAMTVILLGRVPILEMLKGTINIRDHINSLKELPVGMMAFNSWVTVVAASILSSVISNKKLYSKLVLRYLVAVLLLAVLWQGTRQFILLSLFLIVVRAIQADYPISFASWMVKSFKYGVFIVGFVFLFITIQYVRLQGHGSNNFELFMYLAWPTLNMVEILDQVSPFVFVGLPTFTVWQILPNRLYGESLGEDLKALLFESTSPSGYLSVWYLDYGYAGIAIGSLVLGYFAKKIYSRRFKSEAWLRINNLVLWVCVTSGVYSHFLHLNFFIMPAIILLVHGFVFRKRKLKAS